ncbi:MAG: hypothetical protein IKQ16_06985 [Lentisphaeria bacterium]|jgi:hypothetical protein|nr:hypothetical protein [Lentisphaeria bacterium]
MATNKTAKKETAPAKKTAAKPAAVKAAPKKAAKAAAPKAAPKAVKAAPVKTNDPEENIKRFAKTPLAMNFVKAHNGSWNHTDWLNFLRDLEERGYFPIDTDRVGLILEDRKKAFFAK